MYNIKSVKQGSAKIQNNLFTWIIILLTLIIGILYIERLFNILKIEELKNLNVMDFIQLFNSILAALAIGSSLVCYISSKKEELFIISLMYIIFFIDIIFGNLDNINLQSQTKYMDGYITIDAKFECQIIYMKCTYQVPPHLNLCLSSSKGI